MEITIPEAQEKGNSPQRGRYFVPSLILLAALGGFGLGRLVNINDARLPVTLENSLSAGAGMAAVSRNSDFLASESTPVVENNPKMYVAARGGTVYYLPVCAQAGRIAEKNKIWFESKEDAQRMGFKPSVNCKEMQ